MISAEEIKQKIVEFDRRFGRGVQPSLYFAPGRVNLIGEHTDYNGGYVLPIAVEQGTYMLIRKSELPPSRLFTANLEIEARFNPSDIKKEEDWADYVRGVYLYASEIFGSLPPFDALYFGDLPLSSGLSSSASIELVTAIALESLGCNLSKAEAVKIARRAENEFVGVSCGVMDQFASAFAKKGHALLLNCDNLDFRLVPFNLQDVSIVVANTGVKRSLVDSAYNERRSECEEALSLLAEKIGPLRNLCQIKPRQFEEYKWVLTENLKKRAEHVIYENLRVEEAARCLEAGQAKTLGHLMNRSHESLRDLFEVSSHELDTLQEISLEQQGVFGCRMTGAGFGGCVVCLVETSYLDRYLRRVPGLYWKATHLEAEMLVVAPGEGARKVEEF